MVKLKHHLNEILFAFTRDGNMRGWWCLLSAIEKALEHVSRRTLFG